MKITTLILIGAVASGLLAGCATPIRSTELRPKNPTVEAKHNCSLKLIVEGGLETDSAGTRQISGPEFEKALRESIQTSGLFTNTTASQPAYELKVNIISVVQPTFGLNISVSMSTQWQLSQAATRTVKYQNLITKSGKATLKDGVTGYKRCTVATIRAAQDTIEEGLKQISRLNL